MLLKTARSSADLMFVTVAAEDFINCSAGVFEKKENVSGPNLMASTAHSLTQPRSAVGFLPIVAA